MKKIFKILWLFCLVLSLVGCSNKNQTQTVSDNNEKTNKVEKEDNEKTKEKLEDNFLGFLKWKLKQEKNDNIKILINRSIKLFETLNTKSIMLDGKPLNEYVKLDDPKDATSLDNVKKSLELLINARKEAKENIVYTTSISDVSMALTQIRTGLLSYDVSLYEKTEGRFSFDNETEKYIEEYKKIGEFAPSDGFDIDNWRSKHIELREIAPAIVLKQDIDRLPYSFGKDTDIDNPKYWEDEWKKWNKPSPLLNSYYIAIARTQNLDKQQSKDLKEILSNNKLDTLCALYNTPLMGDLNIDLYIDYELGSRDVEDLDTYYETFMKYYNLVKGIK